MCVCICMYIYVHIYTKTSCAFERYMCIHTKSDHRQATYTHTHIHTYTCTCSERYDYKADIFSFGVILWEIHARKIPYSDMNQMQIAVAVATQDHRPPPPNNCPAPFWELMQTCWKRSPRDRPSFPEV